MPPALPSCRHIGCKAIAPFGRDVFRRKSVSESWSCREHLWPDFFSVDADGGVQPRELVAPATIARQGSLL